MTEALALLIAGLCDRIRGGWPEGRPKWIGEAAKYVAGGCMATLVTSNLWLILAAAGLVGQLSWRQDNGWRGDWVRGTGKITSALRWGALWSIPLMPLAIAEPRFLLFFPCGAVGSLLTVQVSVKLPWVRALDLRHGWPWSELVELPVVGLLVLLCLALHGQL